MLVDCLEYRPGGAEIARKNPSKENSVGSEEKNILKKIESSTLKIKLLKLMNTGLGEPRLLARILPRIFKKIEISPMKIKLLKLRNLLKIESYLKIKLYSNIALSLHLEQVKNLLDELAMGKELEEDDPK